MEGARRMADFFAEGRELVRYMFAALHSGMSS